MENYKKGKNVEEPLEREKISISNLPQNFLWMHVRGGSKIRNLLNHALNEIPEVETVVWTGFGHSVGKAITCAEIMKKECNNSLHQITKICYRLIEEYWDPIIPELDQLVVRRKLPMIHICLSKIPLDENDLGYQAPGLKIEYKPQRQHNKQKFNKESVKNSNASNNKINNRKQRGKSKHTPDKSVK